MIIATIAYFLFLTITAAIFGKYIALIYDNHAPLCSKWFSSNNQTWKKYFTSLMCFNFISILFTFAIIYWQEYLPYSKNVKPLNFASSLNAAISFTTSTFWQSHNPETELSIFSQIAALTLQNFLSSATGITVFVAFIRGVTCNNKMHIGNFYSDLIRALVFILIPISIIVALLLISQGVPHDFIGNISYQDLSGNNQNLFIGPIAGQTAIKTLVSNGGSLLSAASAHPFEAPSRFIVMFQLWLVLLMPAALIFTYGELTKEPRLGWSLYITVILLISIAIGVLYYAETEHALTYIFPNIHFADAFNFTGKELIYDKFPSLTWMLAITTSSSGSQNICIENFTPLSMFVLFANLVVGKFMLEGVGSGFFTMLTYLMIAVFIKGLITGRTQHFCGKKISINDINYVVIVLLLVPIGVLLFSAITLFVEANQPNISRHGLHFITDVTYNFASAFTNNGSVLTGMDISSNYFNYMSALAMFLGRYATIYYSLALSGSFAQKNKLPSSNEMTLGGELSLFLVILVLMIGALTFLPVLILGPLNELIKM